MLSNTLNDVIVGIVASLVAGALLIFISKHLLKQRKDSAESNGKGKKDPCLQYPKQQMPKLWPFFGRDEELTLLRNRLFAYNLVLLKGIGGIGKTQLAVKLSEDLARENHKVIWYEFKKTTNLDQFLDYLACHLESPNDKSSHEQYFRQKDPKKRERMILNLLNKGHYALFLDDVHFIENKGVDEFFSEFGGKIRKSICLLIGRRSPNFIKEEKKSDIVIQLSGLKEKDSIKLLEHKGICECEASLNKMHEKLEGHPKALELAAELYKKGRLDVNRPISEKLSIDELFGEIYCQLSDNTKRVATAIAITKEDTNQEALIDVFQNDLSEKQLETALDSLHQWSLIRYENGNISSHSLARDYFLNKAHLPYVKELHKKMAQWYERTCEVHTAEDVLKIYYHWESSGDLHDAVEKLISFDEVFTMQGYCKEFIRILQKAAEKINDYVLLSKVHSSLGRVMTGIHDYNGAVNHYNESLRLFQLCRNDKGIAQSYSNLAKIFLEKRQWDKAIENYEVSLKIFEKLNDRENIFKVHINLADAWLGIENLEKATEHAEISQELIENNEIEKKARIYNVFASIYDKKENYEKAEEYYNESMRILGKSENETKAETCDCLGSMHFRIGNLEKALEYYRECERLFKGIAHHKNTAIIWWKLGRVYMMKGQFDPALDYFKKSKDEMKRFEDLELYPLFMAGEAEVYDKKGDHDRARNLYSEAREKAEEKGKRNIAAYIESKLP